MARPRPSATLSTPLTADQLSNEEAFLAIWERLYILWDSGASPSLIRVHGLLFYRAVPMTSDEIMTRLGYARGNANTNLRRLIDQGLVRRSKAEKRERFTAVDMPGMLATLLDKRDRDLRPIVVDLGRLDDPTGQVGRLAEVLVAMQAWMAKWVEAAR